MTANQMRLFAFGATDTGLKRERNEDSYLIDEDLGLYVVADGMGGHAGGATASRLAVDSIGQYVHQNRGNIIDAKSATGVLKGALKNASHRVHDQGMAETKLFGMGTTTTAALLQNSYAVFGHVGDSRAYLIRDGQISQLTEDHSWVHEQVKSGLMTEDEAKNSRYRNVITRSIGFEDNVEIDTVFIELRPNDCILLCTDGLTTMASDQEILQAFSQNMLYKTPEVLIDLANKHGGDDNITAIVIYACEIADKKVNTKKLHLNN